MQSQSEYRPRGPEEMTSKRYAEDLAELLAYGRFDSAVRTAEQTETVRFHTEQTFFQFNRTLRELAVDRGLDLRESARLLGYVNVATADTIACWEAKFHYSWWRPTHAISEPTRTGTEPRRPTRPGRRSSSATIRSTRPATRASPAP